MKLPHRSRTKTIATRCVRFSISVPAQLAADALKRQADLRLGTFSDYAQHAMRKDLGLLL